MKYYGIRLLPDKDCLKKEGVDTKEFYDSINHAMAKIGFHPIGKTNLFVTNKSPDAEPPFRKNPVEMILDCQEMLYEENWAFCLCKSIKLVLIDELGDLRKMVI